MRSYFLAWCVVIYPLTVLLGQTTKTPPPKHPAAPGSQEVETEQVTAPAATQPPITARTSTTGFLEPEQVKALLHKTWLTEYRINDLLAQVHPEHWRMPDAAKKSFAQTLESLNNALKSQEEWRAQFENRPDSLYFGFQTYVAINAVLPRLEGLAHSVTQYENASFGAQYSQAANQLFDLQQSLQPHLALLLKNQDGLLLAAQTNIASCQNELGYALHSKERRATPMKNIAPEFKGRGQPPHAVAATNSAKRNAAEKGPASKPAANPSPKTQEK